MSLESGGGCFGNLNIVQLYEDSVDLGQVTIRQHPIDNPTNWIMHFYAVAFPLDCDCTIL